MNREEKLLLNSLVEASSFDHRVKLLVVGQTWGKPQNVATTEGFPDTVLCANGHSVLLELKSKQGILEPAQKRLHAELSERANLMVPLVRSYEDYVFWRDTLLRAPPGTMSARREDGP